MKMCLFGRSTVEYMHLINIKKNNHIKKEESDATRSTGQKHSWRNFWKRRRRGERSFSSRASSSNSFNKRRRRQNRGVLKLHDSKMEYLNISLGDLFDKLNLQVGKYLELSEEVMNTCTEALEMFREMGLTSEILIKLINSINQTCPMIEELQSQSVMNWLMQIHLSAESLDLLTSSNWEVSEHLFYPPLHGIFFRTLNLVSEAVRTDVFHGTNSETQFTKMKPEAFTQDYSNILLTVEEDKLVKKVIKMDFLMFLLFCLPFFCATELRAPLLEP